MDILGSLRIGTCDHYREKIIGDKLFAYRASNTCKGVSHAVFDISAPTRRPAFEGYKKWFGKFQEVVVISTYKYFALGEGGLAISKNQQN